MYFNMYRGEVDIWKMRVIIFENILDDIPTDGMVEWYTTYCDPKRLLEVKKVNGGGCKHGDFTDILIQGILQK